MKIDTNIYRILWRTKEGDRISDSFPVIWTKDFFDQYVENSSIKEKMRFGNAYIGQYPIGNSITIQDICTVDIATSIGIIKRIDFEDGIDIEITNHHLMNYLIGLLETKSIVASGVYLFKVNENKINCTLLNIYLMIKDKDGEYKFI